jgi:hypothetical protein
MIIVLVAALICLSPLHAGRYAGDFMMIGAGVRPLGMGGAFAAIADDGSAIYWNSAGLSQIRNSEVSAMHAFLYNGLASYDHVTYVQPLPNQVSIAFNFTRLTVSDIPYFDEKYLVGTNVDQRINDQNYHLPGVPDSKFNASDELYQFSFSKNIHYDANMGWLFFEVPFDFSFGGNIKLIKRIIGENTGNGTGLDFGIKAKTDLAVIFDQEYLGDLLVGVNFQDIAGTEIAWDTQSEIRDEVLFNSKFGLAVVQPLPTLKSKVSLAYDYDYVYNGTSHYGLEWEYDKKGSLRAGYYDSNYSAGASVKLYGVLLDYALITNPVGLTNRIGLRVQF